LSDLSDDSVDRDRAGPVEVEPSSLSAVALRGLIEEFVSRDGTDYGIHERDLEDKVEDVRRQLERGDAIIVFDPEAETVNIVLESDYAART